MDRRKCINKPDMFCYICGKYIFKGQQRKIDAFVKSAYLAYFKIKLGDQDKIWAPKKVCNSCTTNLRLWLSGKREKMGFAIPMIWREPQNHDNDCYFCSVNITGHSKKDCNKIIYPNLNSAIRPVSHGDELPIPKPPENIDILESDSPETDEKDKEYIYEQNNDTPQKFTQEELNDLIRDLKLTKDDAQKLGAKLKSKNLLTENTKFSWYRHREKEFAPNFIESDSMVFCSNVKPLVEQLGFHWESSKWRLFIDSSKHSLKGVLLNNLNEYPSIPIAYSTTLKETYETLKKMLQNINYSQYKWEIVGDFKVIGLLLGQQGGYTKFPCYLCEWDSRAREKHWQVKNWPKRTAFISGIKNIIHQPLVDSQKIIMPPLHIKLGLMKQFVKALPKDGACFNYLCLKFPALSQEKLKEGIFIGPQINNLFKDQEFEKRMKLHEKKTWKSFKSVCENFLGNKKDPNYKQLVKQMLDNFYKLGCNMSLKVHCLHSHLDIFPDNMGKISDEHGERFHQEIKFMEKRYHSLWSRNMLADYCWMLKREVKKS
jgi:hypothetical protein